MIRCQLRCSWVVLWAAVAAGASCSNSVPAGPDDKHDQAVTPTASASTSKEAPTTPQDPAPARKPAREKKKLDPAETGTIRGVVKLDGQAPARKEMAIGNTAGCEKHPVPPLTEDVLVKDGKLANVFVYIKSGLEDVILDPPASAPVVLNQEGCMYRPRVLGMQVGQTLAVKNSDPATHNVHSRAERNDSFNKSQPARGADVEWTPTKAELSIPFACDIHPWMKAWVHVREHPFFAVTDADGAFTLAGVPPGDYVIEAWHEKYGKKTGKLTLASRGTAEITLAFAVK